MERNPETRNKYFNAKEDEISWITSGLYDSKNDENSSIMNKVQSYLPGRKTINVDQYRRQSEPIISEISNPNPRHHSKYAFNLERSDEYGRLAYLCSGNMKQVHPYSNSTENSPKIRKQYTRTLDKCFLVNLYIETRDSHLGPFPFEIHPKMNVRLLKLKVEKEHGIPASSQKWILNKSLAIDNDLSLFHYGIIPGSPIFLYVDSSYENAFYKNQLCSLIPESSYISKSRSSYIDTGNSYFTQQDLNSTDYKISSKFASYGNPDAHTWCKDSLSPDSSQLLLTDSGEGEGRPKNTESLSKVGNFSCLPVSDSSKTVSKVKCQAEAADSSVHHQRKYPNLKNGPFKPVFAKVRDKKNCGLINSKNPTNVVSSINTNLTIENSVSSVAFPNFVSSFCEVLDCSVSNKSESSSENIEISSIVTNNSHSLKTHTGGMDFKIPSSKKCYTVGLDDIRVASSHSVDKTSDLKSKRDLSSILQKVKLKHKTKSSNENARIMDADMGIKDKNVAEGKITEVLLPLKVTSEKSEKNMPSNFVTENGHVNVQNPIPAAHSIKTDIHNDHGLQNKDISTNTTVEELCLIEANEKVTEELKNIRNSISIELSESINHVDASEETKLTEVSIDNITNGLSPENVHEYSESTENINELSSSGNIQQEMQEENERWIKQTAENYEFLLKMEDLNLVKNVVNFTCPICFGDFESDQGVVLHECLHLFCVDCLARTVDYAEEVLVKCPYRDDEYSCQSYLQQREIKALVSPEVYDRYLQRSIITAESLAEKSFHCITPDCPGWCMFEDNINIFHCPVCFHYNCLNCRTIHEGLNCRQYQDKLKSQKKVDPDSEKTLEFLNKMIESGKALKCPKCDLILMKKWGCDWLKCAVCLTEICWITKGPRWGPGGQGDTSGGCRCGVNGIKCHPSCTYCH